MFSNIRQDGIIYVLDKTNIPKLLVGRVSAVSNPVPKYSTTYNPIVPGGIETTVDISVNIDGKTYDFKKVPSNASIYGENGVVISESKEAMNAEVEAMQANSRKIIESVDFNKQVIESCDGIIAQLNPNIAKDKENDKKISDLEKQVASMNSALSDMNDMLKKLIN